MVKLVSWNMAHREDAWRFLAEGDADVGLLQEAVRPPDDIADQLRVDTAPWETAGAGVQLRWRTAVVGLSDRVRVEHLETASLPDTPSRGLAVSRLGTMAAALVTPHDGEPFFAVSLYAVWERPHELTRSAWIFADGSAHRLISDLSALAGRQAGHRLIAAGDLNILHGYGDHGSPYWASRYATVFDRMSALGFSFVGPQYPAGRQADPWPDELPRDSDNIPTYRTKRQDPATATRQLDFVFASNGLASRVHVTALNEHEQWGPSDHCRVEIEIR